MTSSRLLHTFRRHVLVAFTLAAVVFCATCTAIKVERAARGYAVRGEHKRRYNFVWDLPFIHRRGEAGKPLDSASLNLFTQDITGFYRDRDFFNWIRSVSFGMDPSSSPHDFAVWWVGMQAVKKNGSVRFMHLRDLPDNSMLHTGKVLSQAACGYLLSADTTLGWIVEQYSKGVSAQFKAMVWDSTDTAGPLMARAVFPPDHRVRPGRRDSAYADYSAFRIERDAWNSQSIRIERNPYWGDIWVRNMRSKDDLPNLFRAGVFLRYVARYGAHANVRAAAGAAAEDLAAFAASIVARAYSIPSRDSDGRVFVPQQDLANLARYDIISPRGECPAKLTVALYAYGRNLRNHCGNGYGSLYSLIAPRVKFYNLAIIRGFHMDAVLTALTTGHPRSAHELLRGLSIRADDVTVFKEGFRNVSDERWRQTGAVFLVQAAACGVPLTWSEVRLIHQQFSRALVSLRAWDGWDIWDESKGDGEYDLHPPSGAGIGADDLGVFLEYCFSPFRNPRGAPCIDCVALTAALSQVRDSSYLAGPGADPTVHPAARP